MISDYERQVIDSGVEMFHRLYDIPEDGGEGQHLEDALRTALLHAVKRVTEDMY